MNKSITEKRKEVFDFSFFIVFLQKIQLIHEEGKTFYMVLKKVLTINNSL